MEVDIGNVVVMVSMFDYDLNVEWDYEKIKYIYRNGIVEFFFLNDIGKYLELIVLLGLIIKLLSVLIGLNEGFFVLNLIY